MCIEFIKLWESTANFLNTKKIKNTNVNLECMRRCAFDIFHIFHSNERLAVRREWTLPTTPPPPQKRLTVLEAVQIYWMTISLFLLRSLSLKGVFFSSLKFMSSWWKNTRWSIFRSLYSAVIVVVWSYSCCLTNSDIDEYTIIFSKRASISFSEVILDDSSSNWFETDDEDMDQSLELCLYWDNCCLSFLLPGIRILANLSSWTRRKETIKKLQNTLKTVKNSTFVQSWNVLEDVLVHERMVILLIKQYK